MEDLKAMTREELAALAKELGQPAFRGNQLFDWMLKGAEDFEQLTNLPVDFRRALSNRAYISFARIERKFISQIDGTVKYLFRLRDGKYVESVVMEYKHGRSICISTQVGCRMGCAFCASTIGGMERCLTAGEMLSQIFTASRDLNVRISNVVLMGMGEPLDNFDQTMRFLKLVGEEKGLSIGARHISLSTCGLVDRIRELAAEKSQITLSVSLHAPNDEIRSRIMPVNRKWPVEELLSACREYTKETGRRISFEYAMINGLNDSDDCARMLANQLKGMLCHVNLIPANSVKESAFSSSGKQRLRCFQNILNKHGVNATVRRTLGADISASCGQLRKAVKNEPPCERGDEGDEDRQCDP